MAVVEKPVHSCSALRATCLLWFFLLLIMFPQHHHHVAERRFCLKVAAHSAGSHLEDFQHHT